jgi:hypothetical protein
MRWQLNFSVSYCGAWQNACEADLNPHCVNNIKSAGSPLVASALSRSYIEHLSFTTQLTELTSTSRDLYFQVLATSLNADQARQFHIILQIPDADDYNPQITQLDY